MFEMKKLFVFNKKKVLEELRYCTWFVLWQTLWPSLRLCHMCKLCQPCGKENVNHEELWNS